MLILHLLSLAIEPLFSLEYFPAPLVDFLTFCCRHGIVFKHNFFDMLDPPLLLYHKRDNHGGPQLQLKIIQPPDLTVPVSQFHAFRVKFFDTGRVADGATDYIATRRQFLNRGNHKKECQIGRHEASQTEGHQSIKDARSKI